MQVTVIIVTYADRYYLLKEVLVSCLNLGVNDIIIVDNNSEKNSKEKIKKFLKDTQKVQVISNKQNVGSAKAYKQGLEKAYKLNNEYIWLLDDDNKPRARALSLLLDFWNKKPKTVSALLSFRPDRVQFREAVFKENPNLVLSKKNSFSGFHLFEKISRIYTKEKQNKEKLYGEIACAPYGGLFFHKSLLKEIGYPNEKFYLYSDDHEWTYRITKRNKKIYLVLDSIVDDIDTSWAIKDKKETIFSKIKKAPPFRVYYTIRNRTLFEKQYLVNNNFIYGLNKLLFTVLLFIYSSNTKNFKVFMRAVKNAENNNLEKY
ncbi:MAG: Uncharacterised protein [Flavobacterium sp. SCGC AAA160-P02]|nr:MAG: Uncharacterised protein [Flavobacterium sp. SCGC AAA160-P02]